ncbi:MAG: PAS domain S-box protein, partial [Bryobacteraceae bacterium]
MQATRTAGSTSPNAAWLLENGPRELELLFRAIVYHPSAPLLIVDDEGNSKDVSTGGGKLLGLPREKIIGQRVDDFAPPDFRPQISELWRALQERGEQEGTLRLMDHDGIAREVEYTAKGNVLPVRHLLVLHDKTARSGEGTSDKDAIPSWVQDYALFLFDVEGHVVTWYSGAERIYGYEANEAIGKHVSFVYPDEDVVRTAFEEKLKRVAAEGHLGNESWHLRKDGTRFWANVITMALRREDGT